MIPTAYEGPEKYVFISYAHADRDEVFKVLYELEKNGCRFWYDDGIAPGSEWAEDIARHLNASAAVMAFISKNAVKSSNCRREINYALSKEKPFLSVVLEATDMSEGLEMQLSSQQSVIRHNYSTWERFIGKVLSWQGLEECKKAEEEVPAEAKQEGRIAAAPAEAGVKEAGSQAGPAEAGVKKAGSEACPADTVVKEEEAVDETVAGKATAEAAAAKKPAVKDTVAEAAASEKPAAKEPATEKPKFSKKRKILAAAAVALALIIVLAITHPWSIKTSWGDTLNKGETFIYATGETITSEDMLGLSTLSQVEQISFSDCDFSDCDISKFIQNNPELVILELENCTGISDYSFLDSCKLKRLSITNSPAFTDISGVDLSEAVAVDISGTSVEDISPLKASADLTSLNIANTPVTSLDAIASANNLEELDCSGCTLKKDFSISPLRLEKLCMHGCGISDFSTFKNCTLLTTLDLGGNPGLKDMSWLDSQNYAHIETLDLSDTALDSSDLSFIASCQNLKKLNLDGVSIEDLDFCENKTSLSTVSAQGCGLKDIKGLSGCLSLCNVFLSFNAIGSIEGLQSLDMNKSVIVDLAYNDLSDVSLLPNGKYGVLLLTGNDEKLASTIRKEVGASYLVVDWYDDITKAPFTQNSEIYNVYVVGTPDSQKLKVEEAISLATNTTSGELYQYLLAENKLSEYILDDVDYSYAIELYKASK